MKRMPLSRLFALPLALTLLLSPAAQALTPDQARELLQDYYIDEVPEDVLDQNTIQAMLEALGDPYTTYFSPEEYGAFTGSMSDTDTVGVGIYSLVTADGPLIQRVYENTPAADAGLQPGDLVTAVDGRSTAGQDAGTVAAWLKGDPGTRVEPAGRGGVHRRPHPPGHHRPRHLYRAVGRPHRLHRLRHLRRRDGGPLRQRHGGHRRRS